MSEEAAHSAVMSSNKITLFKNAAYAYYSLGNIEKSIENFRHALDLTSDGSFQNALISAEIAELEQRTDDALAYYEKAYELDPTDYQVNNSLGLFYLGLESYTEPYSDYEKALVYTGKAYGIEPNSTSRSNYALAKFYANEYDGALDLYQMNDLEVRSQDNMMVGFIYMIREEDELARQYLMKAIDLGLPAEDVEVVKEYLEAL